MGIPPKLRKELAQDPWYKICCLKDGDCEGRIEWHHNLIFANRQVSEKEVILPLCVYHHSIEKHTYIGEELDWIMLNRMTTFQLLKYTKAIDYFAMRIRLNKKFGEYKKAT